MTVLYALDSKFGGLITLFYRWRGSIFKLVWRDLLVFLVFYFAVSVLYRFGLEKEHQIFFEKIVNYFEKYGSLIPVSFILGFYVSLVIGRWWQQYLAIPWIDSVAIWASNSIRGEDDETRMIRRTLCRYVCLGITQCFTLISTQSKARFPTIDHLITAGLATQDEKIEIENVVVGIPKYQVHWIPFVWATTLVTDTRASGKILSDTFMKTLIDEINKIKDQCNLLLSYDRIRVPLVYTQVVTIAVYAYFFACIIGKQWVYQRKFDKDPELDLVVPIFTILQFVFYMGWLKVAETLVNPFGDDDYDFELNWMIDRHLQVSYSIVDKMHFKRPALQKDEHWEEIVPPVLPHTIASIKCNNDPPPSSTHSFIVPEEKTEVVSPSHLVSIATIAKADIKFRKRNVFAARKLQVQAEAEDNMENEMLPIDNGDQNDIPLGDRGATNLSSVKDH